MGSGSSAHAKLNAKQAALKTCFDELQKQEIQRKDLQATLKAVEEKFLDSADQKDEVSALLADLASQTSANAKVQERVQTALTDLEDRIIPDADTTALPPEVLRELRSLRTLVDQPGFDDQAQEDNGLAIGEHLQFVAPYLADPDAKIRLAVVEALTSLGHLDRRYFQMPVGTIQAADMENLQQLVIEDDKQNVVHYAALQPSPNALYMLATAVDWAMDPRALRDKDAKGRNLANLVAEYGHMECLAMMVGEEKLPCSALLEQDFSGRSPLHHLTRHCDVKGLQALLELVEIGEAELRAADQEGCLPQHLAAAGGFARFLELLVTHCSLPSDLWTVPDRHGRTVAHLAAQRGDAQLLRCLVETCQMPLAALELTDHWRNKSGAVFTLLKVAWQPFIKAVAGCASAIDADPDVWDWEELRSHLRTEALQGARPIGAVLMVKSQAHPMLLKELIRSQVITPEELLTPDMLGRSCLHRAAASGQAEALSAVKELSDASDEALETKDIQGRTLLHHAVVSDDAETVRLAWGLMPGLFDDLQGDRWHMSPTHLAASISALNAMKVLVQLGARMDRSMGPLTLEDGSVVLVGPPPEPHEGEEANWRLGLVRRVHADTLTVKFNGSEVVVALLSGRSCGCGSLADRKVSDLKEEAEQKMGVSIKTLIGPDYQALDLSKTLEESEIEPGVTLTAVIAAEGEVPEELTEAEDIKEPDLDRGGALHEPKHFIEFLISADVRLVRLEFLLELSAAGQAMPRRQEAETIRTKGGATALVELQEYRRLQVDEASGHVSLDAGLGGQMVTVYFHSVSHMWESMEHPDPWRYQLNRIADMYRSLLGSGLVWVFIDVMSLYQYRRNESQETSFQSALHMMHMLYSHEIVQVDILEDLTPESVQHEGSVLAYDEATDSMKLKPISELRLNPTPHPSRGWCQAEKEWARLRNMLQGTGIPTPPALFKKRMVNMKFTHRNDAEQVLDLQAKVFSEKVAGTSHLLLENLTADDVESLHEALPFYRHLKYVVVNGNALSGRDAVSVIQSGAVDIQMESCELTDSDAVMIADILMIEAVHLKSLSLMRNRIGPRGQEALRAVMQQRPDLRITSSGQIHCDAHELPVVGAEK